MAPVEPVKRRPIPGARISIHGEARWSDGRIEVEARCRRASSCRGLLTAQFRKHRGGRLIGAGSAAYAVGSGSGSAVRLPATEALRNQLARRGRLKLRLTAATRAEDGAVRLTHAKRFIAG